MKLIWTGNSIIFSRFFFSFLRIALVFMLIFRSRPNPPESGVQQTGLCVSGLSIQEAAKLIEFEPYFKSTRLIINIGSVDILHDHELVEMCSDFEKLIKVCEKRKLTPIITTLAPLANGGHSQEMVNKLRKFNVFITEKYFTRYDTIDIWSKMTNPRGVTNFDIYQS